MTPTGFELQRRSRHIDRHCHREGYITVVIEGHYVEAGENGRRRLGPGDVVVHSSFETHSNLIGSKDVQLYSVALPLISSSPVQNGRIGDPDEFIKIAQSDPYLLGHELKQKIDVGIDQKNDWPDLLAKALTSDWGLSILSWARRHNLAPATVSRGFRTAYGVSPKSYRATARARAAWAELISGKPVADLVHAFHFADQAHFCREIAKLTGASPSRWQVK